MATKVIYIGDYQPGKSICSGLDELGNTLKPKKKLGSAIFGKRITAYLAIT